MDKVKSIIFSKSPTLILLSLLYLVLLYVVKWNLAFHLLGLLFICGGVLGIYFLDIAETFFKLHPSPFRSVLFAFAFVCVSLFVVTSSGSLVASGLVLTLFLDLVYKQVVAHREGNLDEWYQIIAVPVEPKVQRTMLGVFGLLFVVVTVLFLRP